MLEEDCCDELKHLRAREVTPGGFVFAALDGKFTDEELSPEGNAFASAYYEDQETGYYADYEAMAEALSTFYHVADSWQTYEKLAPVLERRFIDWTTSSLKMESS